jgi:hypothetical protein
MPTTGEYDPLLPPSTSSTLLSIVMTLFTLG